MTVVGDLAQAGSAAGASSWGEVLDPLRRRAAGGRRADRQLPHAGADHAARGRRCSRPPACAAPRPSRSARATGRRSAHGEPPRRRRRAVRRRRRGRAWRALGERAARRRDGRRRRATALLRRWRRRCRRARSAPAAATLDRPCRCSPSTRSRAWSSTPSWWSSRPTVLAASPRGANDLYVALTRPTQRLGVLHADPLPPGLTDLATA